MLVLRNCRFLCTPKSGSTFCTLAISRAVHPTALCVGDRGRTHASLATAPGHGLPAFGFVRHPLTWFPSYWAHRKRNGWEDTSPLDKQCGTDDFSRFMDNVLELMPGFLSQHLETWLGSDYDGLEFVGRFENLVPDLIAALELFGEDFDREAILTTPPQNVTTDEFKPAPLDRDQSDALCNAEARMIEAFYP